MRAVVRDAGSGRWRVYDDPRQVIVVRTASEVLGALREVERLCAGRRLHAAGFLAYEAAPGLDNALRSKTRPSTEAFPLVCFGLYDAPAEVGLEDLPAPDIDASMPLDWKPSISEEEYKRRLDRIQQLIREGDTYQVNFTLRLRARLQPDPFAYFRALALGHTPPFAAFIEADDWAIGSLSPELFVHRSGNTLESRPMKGTSARGLWFEQDLEHARQLQGSEKQRAENVMIVDMVRNDLGRVAVPGSVRVRNLFDVERYPTVLQLTSTVTAETRAGFTDTMRALFPAASVTGAPKARTSEIIAELECSPRRIYTGAIGFLQPDGRCQFNVAIRTFLVRRSTSEIEYGVGGGIVADSKGDEEWNETRTKSKALAVLPRSFDLIETMLWVPNSGYLLLDRHLRRLLQSADYFGFKLDVIDARAELERLASTLSPEPHRVRLLLSRSGALSLTVRPQKPNQGFGKVALSAVPVDSTDPFLYHKTTNRAVYERACAARPGFDDVVLYNERHEATESALANLVVEIGGELLTPPIRCGLLPGTLRGHLLEEEKIRERVVTLSELRRAANTYLINSVRGFHPVSIDYKTVSEPASL